MPESSTNQPWFEEVEEKKHVRRVLFSLKGENPKEKVPEHLPEEDTLINDFESGSESSLGINCNVVFILPIK